MGSHNAVRWVVAIIAVLGIVALLAWRRNDPGVGDRFPDQSIEQVTTSAFSADGHVHVG